MLNAVNINLVAFGAFHNTVVGQVFALFVHHHRRRRGRRRPRHRAAHLPQPAQRRPRRRRPDEGLSATVLDYAWLIPLIPAVSFVLILSSASACRARAREIGIVAVGASFVLVVRRRRPVDPAGRRRRAAGSEGALRALGRGVFGAEGGHGEAVVTPVVHHVTWLQNGGVEFDVGIQIDGLAVMMLFVVTLISLLVHVYSHRVHARRPPLHPLLRRCSACSPRRCCCSSSPTTRCSCSSAGSSSASARSCSSGTGGRRSRTPTPR